MPDFNIYVDSMGDCTVCGRPMRSKNVRKEFWKGAENAVVYGAKGQCGGCYSRGGMPPRDPSKTNLRHLPASQRPAPKAPREGRNGVLQHEFHGIAPVSTAQRDTVLVAAARRLGVSGAREIGEILGLL